MVLTAETQVVALAGGVGGAKLVYGLAQVMRPHQLTVIGNVADDITLYGLHVSPDLDTVMYTLAEIANSETGWGLSGETWQMLDMLRAYGEAPWFGLGDRDLATHLIRTNGLAHGETLTTITGRLCESLGVGPRLLPVTDDLIATFVHTVEHGCLAFQEYFVRYRWQPVVTRLEYVGASGARATGEVCEALARADLIIFCPSNPVLSIEPILSVSQVRDAILSRSGRCVAVSPFIGGKAVKGPAKKLMDELGLDSTPVGLVDYYEGLLDGLVIDVSDGQLIDDVGVPVLTTSTMMVTREDKKRLAGDILEWVGSVL